MNNLETTLFFCNVLPEHWCAYDGAELVFFPACHNGWEQRKPYKGHKHALNEAPPKNALGTGWPGVVVDGPKI